MSGFLQCLTGFLALSVAWMVGVSLYYHRQLIKEPGEEEREVEMPHVKAVLVGKENGRVQTQIRIERP